jgi:translation initiation factor IF-2
LSIRIYALAKQLKLGTTLLFDICAQLGMKDKGSALASLSDEEVVQVKARLAKSPAHAAGGTAAGRGAADRGAGGRTAGVLRREDYVAPGGAATKVPVLEKKPERSPVSRRPPAEPSVPEAAPPPVEVGPEVVPPEPTPVLPPTVEVPVEVPEPAAPPLEIAATVEESPPAAAPEGPAETPPPPSEPESPKPPPARWTREPLRAIVDLRSRDRGRSGEKKEHEKRERPSPGIKLAPVPKSQQPVTPAAPKEPAPQRPEIRLPMEAIRASKAGGKPLEEHLRKQEQKRKAGQQGQKRPPGRPETGGAAPAEPLAPPRDRRGARRTGVAAEGEPEAGPVLGGREQRQLKRKKQAGAPRRTGGGEEDEPAVAAPRRRLTRLRRPGGSSVTAPRKGNVVIDLPCSVRSFSESLGLPVSHVQGKLLELGVMGNVTAELDVETAELLAVSLGVEADFRQQLDLENRVLPALEQADDPAAMRPRPPIVTFLGHVDHGKTSLLDRIIGLEVAAQEKGGITQHIRAYQVEKDGRSITFLDTPGHEAFTAMRARGANVTDVAVLVVAADDGVMPQTQEAISHARAAGVPILVAMNKIDLPGVKPDRVLQELAANELLPSEWGGDTEVVPTSAVTGQGIDTLMETLLTIAELREYAANPDRPAVGTCLEAEVQQGRGVVAKVLVQKGTLRVGDVVVCGTAHGRIKAMYDTLTPYRKYKEAGPSMPVNLTGLDVAPSPGDRFYVLDDISQARQIAQERQSKFRRQQALGGPKHVTLETLYERLGQQNQVQTLNMILRADVRGSIEAILKELTKLEHPEVQVKVLQAMVGGITEADVHLADASDAVIIGFNVVPDENARSLADQLGVQIRRYDIIYQVTQDLRAAVEGMLKPEKRETELGRVLVQRVFRISRVGAVAGCRVLSGNVQRDGRIRLIRENRMMGDYSIESLRREKDDVREVREGYECGIKLGGFSDLKEGDLFEVYKVEEIRRTL